MEASCNQSYAKVSESMEPKEVSVPVLLPHEIIDAVARAGHQQAWAISTLEYVAANLFR